MQDAVSRSRNKDVAIVPSYLFESGCRKSSTEIQRYQAIEQAILLMRQRFCDPLTLQEIAHSAQLSQFHFNRIFRSMTGVPPSVYLAAIRLEQAKRLLLTTNLSVTDICFDVGYTSLGTFTTRFAQFVGLTPTHLRRFAQDSIMDLPSQKIYDMITRVQSQFQCHPHEASVQGMIKVLTPFKGVIFIGLFKDPVPQGAPVACTLLTSSGRFYLPRVPRGQYYTFATGWQVSDSLFSALMEGPRMRASRGARPITISNTSTTEFMHLTLQQDHWTDPPILIALPWLLSSRLSSQAAELVATT